MKRHFSNRGEALPEVTAARVLADRKAWVRTSFTTQAGRRTGSPFWSSRQVAVTNPPRTRQPRPKEEVTISF